MQMIGKSESGNVVVEMSQLEWRRVAVTSFKPEDLGKEIVIYRKTERMNQKKFADRVGISRTRLSEIERGVHPQMSMRTYQRIIEAIS